MAYRSGDIIDNRYRIVSVIGKGGHGMVYKAEDMDLASPVAIKVLHGKAAASDDFIEGPRAFAEKRKPNWTGA